MNLCLLLLKQRKVNSHQYCVHSSIGSYNILGNLIFVFVVLALLRDETLVYFILSLQVEKSKFQIFCMAKKHLCTEGGDIQVIQTERHFNKNSNAN
jgi:hypothetical protein